MATPDVRVKVEDGSSGEEREARMIESASTMTSHFLLVAICIILLDSSYIRVFSRPVRRPLLLFFYVRLNLCAFCRTDQAYIHMIHFRLEITQHGRALILSIY